MNHIQYEFGLIPTKVVKEDKAEYIQALNDSREEESMVPFQLFMLKEHTKNLRNEITEHKKSQNEDFAYLKTEVVQKSGPEKWSRNKSLYLATHKRERKHHFKRNG